LYRPVFTFGLQRLVPRRRAPLHSFGRLPIVDDLHERPTQPAIPIVLNSQNGNEPGRADLAAAVDPRIRLTASPAEVERLRTILTAAVSSATRRTSTSAPATPPTSRADGDLVPLDTSVHL
jgi:hypothetical protein